MNDFEFLTHLRNKGIQVSVKNDRLKIGAPKGALNAELKSEIQERKPGILVFLHQSTKLAGRTTVRPIEPVAREGLLELSFAQQ